MIARILRGAPATGAPLDEWRTWEVCLSEDERMEIATAYARATRNAPESTQARARRLYDVLPVSAVQVPVLRGVRAAERDRRRLAKWRDCGPTAEECEGARRNEPAPVKGEIER